ncbi:calcineurin-like phosphoesterase family protein [Bacteroides sp.]|uniref:calcineurin-like phosphoesterase family protein n=1 Tax=Bacteroides sp. TaxID=29523 RepID=UPI002618F687|nr:calcineurin-like phosphoesterase family protein [Bacteroides sp.]MDD3040865.1 calcineurin-like phosphoesterase family protein [Bacteroides sp.]
MRKLFLNFTNFFIFTLLLSVNIACSSDDTNEGGSGNGNEDSGISVKPGMNLVGKIMDGTTPLQGVVVSDGYTTATTDDEGIYQMKANSKAEFVFVSVPADCEIPVSNNFPVIYQTITVKPNDVLYKNFSLKKSGVKSQFRLLAVADIQIGDKTDITYLETDIPKIISYLKEDIDSQPIYGISLGDLVWDNLPYYSNYKEQVSRLNIPTFSVIGNHDHDMNVKDNDEAADAAFKENFGPTYYSYNIGQCHFVVLDDVLYEGGADKSYTGTITDRQLAWLKEDLKHISKDKLIILGVHIPTKRRNSNSQVTNNAALYKLLEGYQVRILSGHSHNNYTTTISENIEENSLGSIMGAYWNGDLCNDGSARGFAIYEIEGNQIKNWYYKGTHHERDYQMYLYSPGEAVSDKYKSGIIVNIFTWHTNWSVKLYENGIYKQNLTQNIKEMDPRAYNTMYGSDKPSHRPSAEPEKNCDHMFFYQPTSSWSEVKIEASDPYGNTYVKTITKTE